MSLREIRVCGLDELDDPGCREFRIGEGDWPFKGFVVRKGDRVYAYQNYCVHAGHPLNWKPDEFLTANGKQLICASHGALYDVVSGKCSGGPCRGKSLRTVAVEIRDDEVWVRGPTSVR